MIYMTLESGPHSDADADVADQIMPGLRAQVRALAAEHVMTWYPFGDDEPAIEATQEDVLFALIGALACELPDNYTVAILDTRPEWALKTEPVQVSFQAVKLGDANRVEE